MSNSVASAFSDGTWLCPASGPTVEHYCVKRIPEGWTTSEGHPGGHFWLTNASEKIVRVGHYDVHAALSGQPFDGHLPADCPDSRACPYVY